MVKVNARSIAVAVVLIVLGVILIAGMKAPVVSDTIGVGNFEVFTYGEDGFFFMDLDNESLLIPYSYHAERTFLGALSIMQLIIGVIIMLYAAVRAFFAEANICKTIDAVLILFAVFISLLYMIAGIVFTIVASGYTDTYYAPSTLSYVPLIFTVLFSAVYLVANKTLRPRRPATAYESSESEADGKRARAKSVTAQSGVRADMPQVGVQPGGEEYIISLLIKYKDLSDKGVITQEEFEKKKSELLK